jgi:hypothetical protein
VTSWEIFAVSFRSALAEPDRIVTPDTAPELAVGEPMTESSETGRPIVR